MGDLDNEIPEEPEKISELLEFIVPFEGFGNISIRVPEEVGHPEMLELLLSMLYKNLKYKGDGLIKKRDFDRKSNFIVRGLADVIGRRISGIVYLDRDGSMIHINRDFFTKSEAEQSTLSEVLKAYEELQLQVNDSVPNGMLKRDISWIIHLSMRIIEDLQRKFEA